MNAEEYNRLDAIDARHWFYKGKREIVRYWIDHLSPIASNRLLVDCGAGTGRFAQEMSSRCRVIAVDDHPESLEILKQRLPPSAILEGSCTDLPLEDASADYVTALDVLEHIAEDCEAVREMTRILRPEGLLVITVPAFQALWSDWDVSLHHKRRYVRQSLISVLRTCDPNLKIVHLAYINVLAFPAVYLIRKLRSLSPSPVSADRSEDRIPTAWLNRLLEFQYVATACQSTIPFPFGVGLLAICRKS